MSHCFQPSNSGTLASAANDSASSTRGPSSASVILEILVSLVPELAPGVDVVESAKGAEKLELKGGTLRGTRMTLGFFEPDRFSY